MVSTSDVPAISSQVPLTTCRYVLKLFIHFICYITENVYRLLRNLVFNTPQLHFHTYFDLYAIKEDWSVIVNGRLHSRIPVAKQIT